MKMSNQMKLRNREVEHVVKNVLSLTYKPITQNYDSNDVKIPTDFKTKTGKLNTGLKTTQIGARKMINNNDYKTNGEFLKRTHQNKRNFALNRLNSASTKTNNIKDDVQKTEKNIIPFVPAKPKKRETKTEKPFSYKLDDFRVDNKAIKVNSNIDDDFIVFERNEEYKPDKQFETIRNLEKLCGEYKIQAKDTELANLATNVNEHNIKIMTATLELKQTAIRNLEIECEYNENVLIKSVLLNSLRQKKESFNKYLAHLIKIDPKCLERAKLSHISSFKIQGIDSWLSPLTSKLNPLIDKSDDVLNKVDATFSQVTGMVQDLRENETVTKINRIVNTMDSVSNATNWLWEKFLSSFNSISAFFGDIFSASKEFLYSLFCIDYIFESNPLSKLSLDNIMDKIRSLNITFLLPLISIIPFLYKLLPTTSTYKVMANENTITPYFLLAVATFTTFFFGTFKLDAITLLVNNFKSFNSFDGIASNLERTIPYIYTFIPTFIIDIFHEYCPRAYEYINFRYLDKPFFTLYKALLDLIDDANSIYYSSTNLHKFLTLYNKFKTHYLVKYADSLFLRNDLGKIKLLDDVYLECERRGLLPGKRIIPTIVWLYGPSGVGKSSMALKLAKNLCNKEVPYEKQIYTWNPQLPFQDGYNHQPITIINDYMQSTTQEEELLLISMKDGCDYTLNVSSVDNTEMGIKGEVRFTSKLIIITSNLSYLNNSPYIRSVEAFNRRRDFLVDMEFKKDESFNHDTLDFSWVNFRTMDPVQISGPKSKILKYYEVIEKIRLIYDMNRERSIRRFTQFEIMGEEEEIFVDAESLPPGPLMSLYLQLKCKTKRNLEEIIDYIYLKIDSINWINVAATSISILSWIQIFAFTIGIGALAWSQVATIRGYQTEPIAMSSFIQSIPSGDNMTMKKLPKQVLSRLRIQSNNVNIHQAVMEKISKNLFRLITNVNVDDKAIIRSVIALSIGCNHLIFPKHVLYRGVHKLRKGDMMLLARDETIFEFLYDPDRCVELATDIAIYDTTLIMPPRKDLDNLFINNNYTYSTKLNLTAINLSSDATQIQYFSFNGFCIKEQHYIDDVVEPLKTYIGVNMLRFESPLRYGDCGTVIVANIEGTIKIVGMHVGGNDNTQFCQLIDKVDIPRQRVVNTMGGDLVKSEQQVQGNINYLGDLPKPIFLNARTQIKRTNFYGVLQKPLTEPAVLGPNDPRNKDKIKLIYKGTEKYAKLMKPLPINDYDEILFYLERQHECLMNEDYHLLPLIEAINGNGILEKIDMSTSAGYPYCTEKITKKNFFKFINQTYEPTAYFDQEYKKLINSTDERNEILWTVCLKDERRPSAKILKPRAFVISNVVFTVLGRQILGDFIGKYMKHRITHGGCIGINPYSAEFSRIYEDLAQYESCNDGDYSNFDGTVLKEIYQIVLIFLQRCLGKYWNQISGINGNKQKVGEIITDLFTTACFAKMIVKDQVYEKNLANPSGWFLTLIINEFANKSYMIYAYLHIIPPQIRSVELYLTQIRLYTYGDDNIYAVSDLYKDYYNVQTISEILYNDLGVVYTSGDKSEILSFNKPLKNCTFLKNYFVKQPNGLYMGALKKEVIQEIPSWTRSDDGETMQMLINTTLRFAYFWGPTYFEQIREKLRAHDKNYHYDQYYQLDYSMNRDGCINFDAYNELNLNILQTKMDNYNKTKKDTVKSITLPIVMEEQMENGKMTTMKIQSNSEVNKSTGFRDDTSVRESMRNFGVSMANQNINTDLKIYNEPAKAEIPEVASNIAKLLSRPIIVAKGDLDTTVAAGATITLARIPVDMFSQGLNAQLIANNYVFFKGKIRAQLVVQSTPFTTGGVVMHVDYGLFDPFQPDVAIPSALNQAFIRPHTMFDFSDNAINKVMDIPWKYKKEYCNFLVSSEAQEIARVLLTIIDVPSGQVNYTLYMWIEEADVVVTRIQSQDRIQGFTLFDNSTTVVKTDIKDVAGSVMPSNVVGDQFDLKADVDLSALDNPNLNLANSTSIVRRNANMNYVDDIVDMPKLTSYPKEQIMSSFDDFGTNEDEMSIDYLKKLWSPLPSVNTPYSNTFSYKTTHVPGDILFYSPVGPYATLGSPSAKLTTPAFVTFLDWMSRGHLFWRGARGKKGALDYNLHLYSNRFQSGRLAFVYHPLSPTSDFSSGNIDIDKLNAFYVSYIDINGQANEFTFRTPFVSNSPWKYIYHGLIKPEVYDRREVQQTYFSGTIAIVVITPLRSDVGSPQSITGFVRVRGSDGYEIATQTCRNTGVPFAWYQKRITPFDPIPPEVNKKYVDPPVSGGDNQGEEEEFKVQSEDLIFLGDNKEGVTKETDMITTKSIRDINKKFHPNFFWARLTYGVNEVNSTVIDKVATSNGMRMWYATTSFPIYDIHWPRTIPVAWNNPQGINAPYVDISRAFYNSADNFTFSAGYCGLKGSMRFKIHLDMTSWVERNITTGVAHPASHMAEKFTVVVLNADDNQEQYAATGGSYGSNAMASIFRFKNEVNDNNPWTQAFPIPNILFESTIDGTSLIEFEVPVKHFNKYVEVPAKFSYDATNVSYEPDACLQIIVYKMFSDTKPPNLNRQPDSVGMTMQVWKAWGDEARCGILNTYPHLLAGGMDPIYGRYNPPRTPV
jgi:uridine kinase